MKPLKPLLIVAMLLSVAACQVTKEPEVELKVEPPKNNIGEQLPTSAPKFKVTEANAKDFVKTALGFEMSNPLSGRVNGLSLRSLNENPAEFELTLHDITHRMLNRPTPLRAYDKVVRKSPKDNRPRTTNSYQIQNPEDEIYYTGYLTQFTIQCSVSGSIDVSILDFDGDRQLSSSGEYGYEYYHQCNNGDSIIDGRFAIALVEAIETDDNNENIYENLNIFIEYTNFRLGNLTNVATYDGYFQRKATSYNKRHLVYYIGHGDKEFTIKDLSGAFFTMGSNFAIKSEWYEPTYGESNLQSDLNSPRLEDITTIDDIVAQISFISSSDNPTVADLKNSFKFSQDYSYKSSKLDNGTTEVVVTSYTPFEGRVGSNPFKGKAEIAIPGTKTMIEVDHEKVTITVDKYNLPVDDPENYKVLEYSWEDFKALLGSVTD